jgi:hypothetical protein
LPLGAAALALGAIGLWRAFLMDRWALIALLVFAAVALTVILRVGDYGDTGLDPQGAVRLLT